MPIKTILVDQNKRLYQLNDTKSKPISSGKSEFLFSGGKGIIEKRFSRVSVQLKIHSSVK